MKPRRPAATRGTPKPPPGPVAFGRKRRTLAERRYDDLSERDWMAQVVKTIRQLYGNRCLIYHSHDSRADEWSADSGFPDLVVLLMSRNGFRRRLLFIECKKEGKRATEEQMNWLMGLHESGLAHKGDPVEVYVWRPSDVDTMLEVLKEA